VKQRRSQTRVAATLLATQLMACSSWKVMDPAPVAFLVPQPGQRARVTLTDGTRTMFNGPVIVGGRIGAAPSAVFGVPLTDVRRVEVRRFSWGKTTVLVGVITGVMAVLAAFGAAMHQGSYGGGGWGWGC
jgi:hypothetical protein